MSGYGVRAMSTRCPPISPTVRCGNQRRNCGKLKQANALRPLTSANYATEGYTYRANRRWREASLFDRLIVAAVSVKALTYRQLVTGAS